jgi:hypothetical protein
MADIDQNAMQDSPEQFTGERTEFFEGGPDEAHGGKSVIGFKTNKGHYVRSEHVNAMIQSGQILPPVKTSQVKRIPVRPRNWTEQEKMQQYENTQQGNVNISALEKNAESLGYEPETFDAQLQQMGMADTPQGKESSARYHSKVKGLKAPAQDIQKRMDFEFGPVTDAAFARAKEGEQQAAPSAEGEAPTGINFRQPTGYENRMMQLGQQTVSGLPVGGEPTNNMENIEKEADKAGEAEQALGGKKELAQMQYANKEKASKMPKPPAPAHAVPPLTLTSADKMMAKGLADGSIDPHTFISSYSKFGQQGQQRIPAVIEEAKKINPKLDLAERGLEYKWGSNAGATKTIAAANNATSNIDKLVAASDGWSRTGSPGLNKMLKLAETQMGYQNVTNLAELQTAIGDEVAGVLGYGTSSDLKTRLGLELADPNVSPENFKKNMQTLKDLLITRAKTMAAPMGQYGKRPGIAPPPTKSDGSSAKNHPQASQAEQWARQHPNDPRAKMILQRLGQ